jgi:CRISPR system Cascade subunit CasB
MRDKPLFRSHDAPEARALRDWHRDLLTQPRRGDRARLRRAGTIEDAAMAPAFHRLLHRLGLGPTAGSDAAAPAPPQLADLAAVAALTAAVDTDDPAAPLGRTFGRSREGSTSPRVSPARFRRLLESEDREQRFNALRRLIQLVEKRADLAEIAGVVCNWTPARRRRLAYDYYATAPEPEEIPS